MTSSSRLAPHGFIHISIIIIIITQSFEVQQNPTLFKFIAEKLILWGRGPNVLQWWCQVSSAKCWNKAMVLFAKIKFFAPKPKTQCIGHKKSRSFPPLVQLNHFLSFFWAQHRKTLAAEKLVVMVGVEAIFAKGKDDGRMIPRPMITNFASCMYWTLTFQTRLWQNDTMYLSCKL